MASKMKAEPVAMIIRGRLAFVHAFQPRPSMNPGQDPKFGVCIMIPKKDPQVARIKETIAKLAVKEWGPGADKKLGGTLKTILKDGADQEDKYPEFKGHMYLNASSTSRPGIVDKDNQPVISKEGLYSGVNAFVQVNFYTYDNQGKGVSAGLNNIKVLQLLEAFSARQKPETVEWGELPADVVANAEEETEEDALS
jgi:hypothetical protein